MEVNIFALYACVFASKFIYLDHEAKILYLFFFPIRSMTLFIDKVEKHKVGPLDLTRKNIEG